MKIHFPIACFFYSSNSNNGTEIDRKKMKNLTTKSIGVHVKCVSGLHAAANNRTHNSECFALLDVCRVPCALVTILVCSARYTTALHAKLTNRSHLVQATTQ